MTDVKSEGNLYKNGLQVSVGHLRVPGAMYGTPVYITAEELRQIADFDFRIVRHWPFKEIYSYSNVVSAGV
jgi:hypothetical protein